MLSFFGCTPDKAAEIALIRKIDRLPRLTYAAEYLIPDFTKNTIYIKNGQAYKAIIDACQPTEIIRHEDCESLRNDTHKLYLYGVPETIFLIHNTLICDGYWPSNTKTKHRFLVYDFDKNSAQVFRDGDIYYDDGAKISTTIMSLPDIYFDMPSIDLIMQYEHGIPLEKIITSFNEKKMVVERHIEDAKIKLIYFNEFFTIRYDAEYLSVVYSGSEKQYRARLCSYCRNLYSDDSFIVIELQRMLISRMSIIYIFNYVGELLFTRDIDSCWAVNRVGNRLYFQKYRDIYMISITYNYTYLDL